MAGSAPDLDNATRTQYLVEFKRLPGVMFNTVRCTIPGISINPVNVPTPFKAMPFHGTELEHAPFRFEFILDENHSNYYEIASWIKGLAFPDNFEQFQKVEDSEEGLYSDFTVTIFSSQNNPVVRYHFEHGFPVELGEIDLDSQIESPDPILISSAIEFQNYKLEKLI